MKTSATTLGAALSGTLIASMVVGIVVACSRQGDKPPATAAQIAEEQRTSTRQGPTGERRGLGGEPANDRTAGASGGE
jgi:hypothetical protein